MDQSRQSKRLKSAHNNGGVVPGADDSDDTVGLCSIGNDMLVGICTHLQSNDLASISSTCKYFGEKKQGKDSGSGDHSYSLMGSIAMQLIEQLATNEEKELLQQQYSDGMKSMNGILQYDRLLMLQSPLLFEQLIGEGLDYADANKSKVSLSMATGSSMHTAISNRITGSSGGKHYATFTVRGGGEHVYVGIIRNIQGWNRKGLRKFSPFAPKHRRKLLAEKKDGWGSSSVHCCVLRIGRGTIHSTSWSSSEPGHMGAGDGQLARYQPGETTTINMVLDADNGTLMMGQEGGHRSIIKAGLTGSYCWMATFWGIARAHQEVEMTLGTPPDAL